MASPFKDTLEILMAFGVVALFVSLNLSHHERRLLNAFCIGKIFETCFRNEGNERTSKGFNDQKSTLIHK